MRHLILEIQNLMFAYLLHWFMIYKLVLIICGSLEMVGTLSIKRYIYSILIVFGRDN